MELNIKDAAAFAKVARSTLYAKIKSGELSKTADNKIDTSELLRVFGEPHRQSNTTRLDNASDTENTLNMQITGLQKQVSILEKNLDDAKAREAWLKDQVNDTVRLIEMVRQDQSAPAPVVKNTILVLLAIIFATVAIGLAIALGLVYLKGV